MVCNAGILWDEKKIKKVLQNKVMLTNSEW